MKIVSVGEAFPDHKYSQQELTDVLDQYWRKRFYNVDRLKLFHENLQVDSRRFCIPLEEITSLDGFKQRNEVFLKHALNLGERAIQNALDRAGLKPADIDHIFFTTVTGVATPSIDARLVNKMGMRPDIRRTPIFGLGCLAGAAGISRAADYVKAWPEKTALLLSVELCSLTVQKEDLSVANIVASGLFGDGAAAVIVAGEDAPCKPEGPRIIKTHSSFYHNTEQIMGWDIVDQGFKIVLSPNVPRMVREHAPADLGNLLADTGVAPENINHYVCHPGGPKVLEAMCEILELPEDALALSWKTLREIGNLSSSSVLLILQETIKERNPAPGDMGILMAMGPGFCSEWLLLEW